MGHIFPSLFYLNLLLFSNFCSCYQFPKKNKPFAWNVRFLLGIGCTSHPLCHQSGWSFCFVSIILKFPILILTSFLTICKILLHQGQAKRMQIIMLIVYHQIFWCHLSQCAALFTHILFGPCPLRCPPIPPASHCLLSSCCCLALAWLSRNLHRQSEYAWLCWNLHFCKHARTLTNTPTHPHPHHIYMAKHTHSLAGEEHK